MTMNPRAQKKRGQKDFCLLNAVSLGRVPPRARKRQNARTRGYGGKRARIEFLPLTDTPATQGGATARAPTEDGQRGLERATPKQDKQTHNSRRGRAPSGRTAVTGAEQKKKLLSCRQGGCPNDPAEHG